MEANSIEYTLAAHVSRGARIAGTAQVSAGAWIGPTVELAAGVIVGPGAVIGFGSPDSPAGVVRFGENAYVGPCVHIEAGVEVGVSAKIESGSFIGKGSRLGNETYVGPHSIIMGDCDIREYAVLSAEVFVCRSSVLDTHCQLMPGVKLLDYPCPPLPLNVRGPTVGHCAVLGVNAIIWSGVSIGVHAVVAAGSVVKNDVPEYILVQGSPARPVCDIRWIRTKLGDEWVYPYPWVRYYTEGEDIGKPAQ